MLTSRVSLGLEKSVWLRSFRMAPLCSMALLLVATVGSSQPAGAMQSGPSTAAPKPSSPLNVLLNEKPKVPVVTPQLPAAIPEVPAAIPLPDVSARSLDLGQKLRDGASKLPARDQLDAIQSSVNQTEPDFATKLEEVNVMLASSPNSLQVREEETFWHEMLNDCSGWEQQLLSWANNAQAVLTMLDEQEPVWTATYEEIKGNHDLAPVTAVVEANLSEMRRLRKQTKEALQASVNLQIKVGAMEETVNGVLDRLSTAKVRLKGHVLDRDSLPLWRVGERREIGENTAMFRSAQSRWISLQAFVKQRTGALVFTSVLFVVVMVLARKLYEITRAKQPADELEADAFRVLRHWVALALLVPMIIGYIITPGAPGTIIGLVILLSFIPILIILPPLLNRRLRLVLYSFATMYGVIWIGSWFGIGPSTRRELNFLLNTFFFLLLAYLARPLRTDNSEKTGWRRAVLIGIRILVVVLGISLLSDLFGYLKLAHYLGLACIYSTILGICIFTTWRVLILLLTVGLRSPAAEKLAIVRLHRASISRWVPRILTCLGICIWVAGASDLLSIADPVIARVNDFLDFKIAGNESGATVGGVFGFFLILAVGYAAAGAIRFLFREEIFRRFHMSRGLPELISSVIYYLLMVFFVLAAVNAGGIELNKFTVLTGAFGVGIGFGLQNIINNFVSGLILQFERPIHIDDIIEVDNNTGRVSRIGIRSSTIRTFQGAEVIIPNANLISAKVINWTLSESQRRRELPVGVAYGSDPNLVLKILKEAAACHELVLTKPEPMSYFKGFGESSLDFELHFWVMQENNGMLITSEIALAMMKTLNEAGIEIPFPQRDLHLRSVDAAAAGLLPSNEKR